MSPTKSQILGTDPLQVLDLIDEWKSAFATLEDQAETYKGYVERPGGSTWEGRTAEAASQRALQDFRAVSGARDLVDTAAREISNTVTSELMPALGNAKQIIANAERYDVVTVHEDLSVIYDPPAGTSEETVAHNRKVVADTEQDLRDSAARWWAAEQEAARQITELQTALGDQLNFGAALADVNAIVAEAAGMPAPLPGQPVVKTSGTTGEPGTPTTWQDMLLPPGATPGKTPGSPLDALTGSSNADPGQPANVDDALNVVAGQPVPGSPTLAEQILNPRNGTGKPGDPRSTKSPLEAPLVGADPSAVDQQRARVDAARADLDVAQAGMDAAARDSYMQGPGAGPGRGEAVPLAQSVFDARAELTKQDEILRKLTAAAAEIGLPTAAVSDLPANAEVQGFPAEPPILERATEAFAEGTLDAATTVWDLTMPDVVNMYEVATDYENASDAAKQQAALDLAGMAPIPGAKWLADGIGHGLDGLSAGARHVDDVPTRVGDDIADTAGGGAHSVPDAPSVPHSDTDLDIPDSGQAQAGADPGQFEVRPHNNDVVAYPRAYHPGTGDEMPFPEGPLERVLRDQRTEWTNMDRYYYIQQWHDMGYATPPGGWNLYDIHHVKPREFGGDNSFENLVPVPRPLHNQRITPWWNNFG